MNIDWCSSTDLRKGFRTRGCEREGAEDDERERPKTDYLEGVRDGSW